MSNLPSKSRSSAEDQAEIRRLHGLLKPQAEENKRLRAALDHSRKLPITTPELIRLRNAGQITFDKQVFAIIDFLLEQRECLAGETGVKP